MSRNAGTHMLKYICIFAVDWFVSIENAIFYTGNITLRLSGNLEARNINTEYVKLHFCKMRFLRSTFYTQSKHYCVVHKRDIFRIF